MVVETVVVGPLTAMTTHIEWIVDSYVKLQDLKSLHRLKLHRLKLLRPVADHAKEGFGSDCEKDLTVIEAGLRRLCKNLVLHGHVDAFSEARIAGWACYPAHDDVPLPLNIFFDGAKVGHILADGFRPDLEKAGYGNGCHGFEFIPLKDAYRSSKTIEVCTQNDVIIGSLKK
jgi:hypothetical protein